MLAIIMSELMQGRQSVEIPCIYLSAEAREAARHVRGRAFSKKARVFHSSQAACATATVVGTNHQTTHAAARIFNVIS